jgi:hypothetical protein
LPSAAQIESYVDDPVFLTGYSLAATQFNQDFARINVILGTSLLGM